VDVPWELIGLVDLGGSGEPDPFLHDLPDEPAKLLELFRQREQSLGHAGVRPAAG
jgi:hypothetical protein